MGLDWIDDLLQKAEGLPLVGGIAHDLRFAYEIMRVDPPDPKTVQPQIDSLAGHHTKASQLLSAYNDSLLTLRQSWTGDVADYYFGPQVTAFQIEHDMEPSTVGAGYQLWNRFSQVTDVLDYSRAAHQSAHDTLVELVGLQSELETEVTESAVLLAADVEELAPGEEELEALSIPITVERTGKAVETAQKVEKVGEEIKDLAEVEKVLQDGYRVARIAKIVGTIGAIVGVTLLPFLLSSDSSSSPTNSLPPPNTKISTLTDDQIQQLARTYGVSEDDIRAIMAKYPNMTLKQLEMLLSRWQAIRAKYPNLVGAAGSEQNLLLLYLDLSYDPAKGLSPKGLHEAEVVLDLAEQRLATGKGLRWPIKRDPSGDAEVFDGNNQAWDVKSYVSGMNPPFDLAKVLKDIQNELSIAHENVILDVSRLSPKDAWDLYQAVQARSDWAGKILWWPAPPVAPGP